MKKGIILIAIIGLFLLMLPLMAGAEIVASGTCGDNLTWELDNVGTLTITGTGEMYNGNSVSLFPTSSIKKVIVSSGVTSIGNHAFRECNQMLSVTFPNTLTSIGEYAFYNCSGLARVIFPSNINNIGQCAFENCTSIKSVSIPASLHALGRRIFYGCSDLSNVTLVEGLESIGRGSFENCSNIVTINIPSSVTLIDAYAFNHCTGLTGIVIPGSVNTIGEYAFNFCSELTNVEFNIGLKEIKESAFAYCPKLRTFDIPEGTTTIGNYAFAWGGSNRTLIFPNSLVNIGTELCRDINSRPNTIKARCDSYAYQYRNSRNGTYGYQTGANNYWADAYYIFESIGHNEQTTITKYPTCSETGLSSTVCTICGNAIETDVMIPIVDHDPVSDQNGHDPTCTDTGLTDSYSCIYCGIEMSPQEEIPALGHDWDTPEYIWTDDNSEVTATHVCKRNCQHIDNETVSTSFEKTKDPTCEDYGDNTYYAKFTKEGFTNQERTIAEIDPLGHDWGNASYSWNADNSKVTAIHYCNRIRTHVEIETVSTTSETTATCEEEGETVFTTKKFENTSFSAQTKTVSGTPALGHDWDKPTYTWASDGSVVIATRICKRDSNHYQEEMVFTNSEVTTPSTCNEKGKTTYTAIFENNAFSMQTKTLIDVPSLGHDLVHHEAKAATCTEIGWDAYDTCSRCDYTTYVEKAALDHDLVHHEAQAPTCTAIGWDAYDTCSRCDYSTKVEIPMLEHDWDIDYFWTANNSKVEAVAECKRCDHTETEAVDVTAVIVPPAENTEGSASYTSMDFSKEVFTVQTKSIVIPALKDMSVMRLPNMLSTIEDEAFSNLACQAIIIPDNCTTIGEYAFAGCTNLLYVKIPATVKSCPANAFEGCNVNLVIDWAKE